MGYIKNATLHQNQSSLGRVELQGRRELERTELKPIEIERTEPDPSSRIPELEAVGGIEPVAMGDALATSSQNEALLLPNLKIPPTPPEPPCILLIMKNQKPISNIQGNILRR